MQAKMIEEYTKHSIGIEQLLRENREHEKNKEVEKLKEKLISLKRGEEIINDAISAGVRVLTYAIAYALKFYTNLW